MVIRNEIIKKSYTSDWTNKHWYGRSHIKDWKESRKTKLTLNAPLSSLRQLLATENLWKIMKNAFYKKPKVNFELYDVIG